MKSLTNEQINTICHSYAAKKGFRETPVKNFLGSMHPTGHWSDKACAHGNMVMDARSYKWTPSIVAAIKKGIELACK